MNTKPVIGFDDMVSTSLQDYAPTCYAISKLRSGRTPRYPDKNNTVMTDVNDLYKPGLYYFRPGAKGLRGSALNENEYGYVYFITPDPDESLDGGHYATQTQDKRNLKTVFREVFYLTRIAGSTVQSEVTTRTGVYESEIANSPVNGNSTGWIADIDDAFGACPVNGTYRYIFVNDIGIWVKAKRLENLSPNTQWQKVEWHPAIKWGAWQSLGEGGGTVIADQIEWNNILNKPDTFPPSAHSHTVAWSSITGKPSKFPPEDHTHPTGAHSHAISEVISLANSLAAKVNVADKATIAEVSAVAINSKYVTPSSLSGVFAYQSHRHDASDIDNLPPPGEGTIINSSTINSSTIISANISGVMPISVSSTGVGSSNISLLFNSSTNNGVMLFTDTNSYLAVSANLADTNIQGTVETINGTALINYYNSSAVYDSSYQVPTAEAVVALVSEAVANIGPGGLEPHTHDISDINLFSQTVSQIVWNVISSVQW